MDEAGRLAFTNLNAGYLETTQLRALFCVI
jgi:hypothetical protein